MGRRSVSAARWPPTQRAQFFSAVAIGSAAQLASANRMHAPTHTCTLNLLTASSTRATLLQTSRHCATSQAFPIV